MPTIIVNNENYFYAQVGDGPHLLLLHGFTGSHANWGPLLPSLSARFTVTCLDVLGHGRSSSPANPARYAMKTITQDIFVLCDQLEIEAFHLLGYSMGGRLALFTAVADPNRILSLTLESSSPGLATETERNARQNRDNALAGQIEVEGIESFVNFWERLALWESQKRLNDEVRTRLRQQRLKNSPLGLANSLRGMGTGVQPSLWPQLATLSCPTHLIVGELDHKFVAINQQMAQKLPNARLTIIPQAGHTVHLERPEAFLSEEFNFSKKLNF